MPRLPHSRDVLEKICAVVAVVLGAFLLGITFWHINDTDPMWAIASFVLVYDPNMRAALGVGLARLWLTVLGTGIALASIYGFGIHRWLMPLSLAIGAVACGVFFSDYRPWRTVMVTVALVVGSTLLEPSSGLWYAATRSIEVAAGSLLAIAFSWSVARIVGQAPQPE